MDSDRRRKRQDTFRALIGGAGLFLLWIVIVSVVGLLSTFNWVLYVSLGFVALMLLIMMSGRFFSNPSWHKSFRQAILSFLLLFMVFGIFVLFALAQLDTIIGAG